MFASKNARRIEQLEAQLAHMAQHVARLDSELTNAVRAFETTTPAVLRAELEDLRAALQIDRVALRKQLGKIWGRIGAERDGAAEPSVAGDDELDAFIALQRAHSQGG